MIVVIYEATGPLLKPSLKKLKRSAHQKNLIFSKWNFLAPKKLNKTF